MHETRKEPLGEFQSFGSFPYPLSNQLTDGYKERKEKWAKLLEGFKVAVNVSSSGKPVLRYMYYVNEPGLTLLMKNPHSSTPILSS